MPNSAEEFINTYFEIHQNKLIERAQWIQENRPHFQHGQLLHGGLEGVQLLEDAQLCYIFGIYPGSIVLGQSAIENIVCGWAYSAEEVTERPSYVDAVTFLDENEILAPNEVDGVSLDELNNLRNPLSHFRPPFDDERPSSRAIEEAPEAAGAFDALSHVLKQDAEGVLKTMFSVNRLFGIGREQK